MSSSSKRQLPNVDLEPTEKIRHLNSALIVRLTTSPFILNHSFRIRKIISDMPNKISIY